MADKEHLPRWSLIAFNKAVIAVMGSVPVYLEGDERTTDTVEDFVEVRMDGPDIYRQTASGSVWEVTVDVLVNHKVDPRDHYATEKLIGTAVMAFADTILVKRWGDETEDAENDDSTVGCYQLDGEITINKFGIVDQDTRVIQATIAATYKLTLTS